MQIGPGRGGAYTYDWIEKLLGLDMHSADEILPQFQHPTVGEVIALGANGPRMRLAILEPDRSLVFAAEDGSWVWSFNLYPEPHGTRLVSRNLISLTRASLGTRLFTRLVTEPGSLIMERKMLAGIRTRVERDRSALGEVLRLPPDRSRDRDAIPGVAASTTHRLNSFHGSTTPESMASAS